MTDIPHIIENFDPGFREISVMDVTEADRVETPEQLAKRKELTADILTECSRLDLDHDVLEYLLHQNTGALKLADLSIFDVMMFRDFLRKVETTNAV